MKLLISLILTISLYSCYNKGDYQYIIYMNDGSNIKAWSVESSGGGLYVQSAYNNIGYYLSNTQYKKAVYVGLHNISN